MSVLEYGSEAWRDHCKRVNKDDAEPYEGHEHEESVHEHLDAAKYVFPTGARRDEPWVHHHHRGNSGKYYEKHPDALERHIANWHTKHPEAVEVLTSDGMHKHTRREKDRTNKLASRLDMHPLAWPLLDEAEVVYFGIEGCLKADSIAKMW